MLARAVEKKWFMPVLLGFAMAVVTFSLIGGLPVGHRQWIRENETIIARGETTPSRAVAALAELRQRHKQAHERERMVGFATIGASLMIGLMVTGLCWRAVWPPREQPPLA